MFSFNYQSTNPKDSRDLLKTITANLLIISGFPLKNQSQSQATLLEKGKDTIIKEILRDITLLKLYLLDTKNRILLIDAAVKAANLDIVKALTEKYIKEGFENDIKIPSKDNPEHPYRPVFWLASIVSRYPGIPVSAYKAVEDYLCEKFSIPDVVNINGKKCNS